jgi:hypothetical protein
MSTLSCCFNEYRFSQRNSGVSGGGGKYQVLNQRLDSAGAGRGDLAVSLMWDNRVRCIQPPHLTFILPSSFHVLRLVCCYLRLHVIF